MGSDPEIRQVPSFDVISLREKLASFREQGRLWSDLHAFMEKNSLQAAGPGLAVLHDCKDIDVEVCLPVDSAAQLPNDDRFRSRTLPSENMAILVHTDDLCRIAESYEIMMKWIADHNMNVTGPSREVYISLPPDPFDNSNNLTRIEIQFPVE